MRRSAEVGVLAEILESKRRELGELRRRPLPSAPARRALSLKRQKAQPLALIAEIKRRSPSAGRLSVKLSVSDRASAYERAGARMISVLTDATYFDGSFEHLRLARAACNLPILCKDFVIDEVQLDHARALGADAVLLIVRCSSPDELDGLMRAAHARELVAFVEVATEAEAKLALDLGADLVGVNARDLDTLAVDPARAQRVLEMLPESVTRVHLSGLSSPDAVLRVAKTRVDAALIGEALMRLDDPEPLLVQMVAHAAPDVG